MECGDWIKSTDDDVTGAVEFPSVIPDIEPLSGNTKHLLLQVCGFTCIPAVIPDIEPLSGNTEHYYYRCVVLPVYQQSYLT